MAQSEPRWEESRSQEVYIYMDDNRILAFIRKTSSGWDMLDATRTGASRRSLLSIGHDKSLDEAKRRVVDWWTECK